MQATGCERTRWERWLWGALAAVAMVVGLAWVVGTALGWRTTALMVDAHAREQMRPASAWRSGILFVDPDSLCWLSYARDSREAGVWRWRWTERDGPAGGRPVHWAAPYLGLVRAGWAVAETTTDLPDERALEEGAGMVNVALHVLVLVVGAGLIWWRLGPWGVVGFVAVVVSLPEITWSYFPQRPDHQSLYGVTVLLSVALLVAGGLGWVSGAGGGSDRSPQLATARRCFVAAALAGALGLWVSAAVQSFLQLGVLVAMLLMIWLSAPPREEDGAYAPQLWRWWGWVGAAGSLLAWVLEYAPAFPGMRLEANHPLYAIQWAAMGEVLARLAARRYAKAALGIRGAAVVAGLLVVVVAVPVLTLVGPEEWHALRDPQMQRLHGFISEFTPYIKPGETTGLIRFTASFLFFLLPLALAPVLAGRRDCPLPSWAALWFLFALTLFFMLLCQLQIRWLMLFSLMLALLAGTVLAVGMHALPRGQGRWMRVLAGVTGLIFVGQAGWQAASQIREQREIRSGETVPAAMLSAASAKMLALELGHLRQGRPWRFLADPTYAPVINYYAGIPCLTSLYWENSRGLQAATAILTAEGAAEEAWALAREHGLTHILHMRDPAMAGMFQKIRYGTFEPEAFRRTLMGRMLESPLNVPDWLQTDFELEPRLNRPRRYARLDFTLPVQCWRVRGDERP